MTHGQAKSRTWLLWLFFVAQTIGSSHGWSIGGKAAVDTTTQHPSNHALTTRRQTFAWGALGIASVCVGREAQASESLAATVTDKIYIDIKGIPQYDSDGNLIPPSSGSAQPSRIVIGLFGNEAPSSAEKLKKLVSNTGLPALCKPREERALQREQLEANKVYNSCIEGEDKGVNYDYAQIWRIIENERIDVGSVAGRFVAREPPLWEESSGASKLSHDRAGLVTVKKGNDSGFGFTIIPNTNKALDNDFLVVGLVLEGMDVVQQLNTLPVVKSAKVNYMALSGGPSTKNAPSRSCRYGSTDLYCNENKPLQKLTIARSGVL